MFKIYLKQAWHILKSNRFISVISVLGTALAIMMIMTIIVTDRIKNVSAAPEVNRDMTLYVLAQKEDNPEMVVANVSSIDFEMAQEYLLRMKTPEKVAVVNVYDFNRMFTVGKQGGGSMSEVVVRQVSDSYWDIMSFSFLSGRAFDASEYHSGIKVAVLSESTANKLFPGEDPVGKTVNIQYIPFRVIGVVKDVSPVFKEASGDIWVPVTSHDEFGDGEFLAMLLMNGKHDYQAIYDEVRDIERRYNIANAPWQLSLAGPVSHKVYSADAYSFDEEEGARSMRAYYVKICLIFLIMLLIPAVNLIGFSLSRMQKRLPEIGIRKAFGAKKSAILIQVLYENMLTSLIGGVIGLILSYVVVFWLRYWLLDIPEGSPLPGNAMVSPSIFLAVFFVCILLNLLSAGIPAYRASRMNIIDSLYQNDKRV